MLFTFSSENGLKLHQTIDVPGVLDQKWCHKKINEQSVLAVATANGQIFIYELIHFEEFSLKLLCTCNVTDQKILLLSLDWSTGISSTSNEINIVCSDSNGSVHFLKLCESNCELLKSWKGHINKWGTFEAWIAGFNYWDTNIFFSGMKFGWWYLLSSKVIVGGDDGIFCMYDKRVDGQMVGKSHCHSAGVTSVHSNASKEHVLATGR